MSALPSRVLIAHNAYQYRGGEDAVVEAECALLRQRGHEVELYQRDYAELMQTGKVDAALQALWSSRTGEDISATIRRFRPEIIHVHNTVPLISPSLYWAAARHAVPVVQTLHNFRLLCPQALLLRDGRICEDCVGKVPWRGVVRACYRGSVAQTAVLALGNTVHRFAGTWSDKITRYIALTDFARDKFIAGGLPADRICVKPNFVDLPALPDVPRSGALFVGRLSEEKGVDTLLEMARRLPEGLPIRMVGDGPLAGRLAAEPRIEWLGSLPSDQVYALMREAQLLLLPSICYDNFPRTLVEAFACGLPALVSDLGALPGIVQVGVTGLLAPAGDGPAWAKAVTDALARPDALAAMGRRARLHYEHELSAPANYRQLVEIYQAALRCPAHASRS
ncbi:MAG TPA: glycosyltransferase family 4 protein [Burkholderiaceae bacterium]|jgi:glycosyltransferase involved in cell wall biosynthesis